MVLLDPASTFLEPVREGRRVALRAALGKVEERWGSGALGRRQRAGGELPGAFATGVPELDGLTAAGGFPLGRVSLCLGAVGAGRMLVGYRLLAEASRNSASALLLDLRGHADPWLLEHCQARLDRVLVMRSADSGTPGERLRRSLEAALALVRAGVGCVVVDLPPGTGRSACWDPLAASLAAACGREAVPLLVLGEAAGEPLRHTASLIVRLRRTAWLTRHGDLAGLRVRAQVEKSKLGPPTGVAEFDLAYPRGAFLPPVAEGEGWDAGEGWVAGPEPTRLGVAVTRPEGGGAVPERVPPHLRPLQVLAS